jgi:DNA-binding YbaB/EbfC family protein
MARRKGSAGGLGGLGGGNQMQAAQELIAKAQQELASQSVEGTAGGGMVKVTMSGNQRITGISIQPDVVDPEDVGMLEDLIMAAIGDAAEKSESLQSNSLSAITSGLNLPGLGDL